MNIDFPNPEEFVLKPCVISGEDCTLVTPQHIGTHWNYNNAIFRSSIWTSKGTPVSLGFRKFVNWGENPENFPEPKSLKNVNFLEKIDGSLCIVSFYKGNQIIRTRGSVDTLTLDSAHEIETLKQKYPQAFGNQYLRQENCTFLFEWVGSHKIVIDYGVEPDIYLVGVVNHENYSYWTQENLDAVAISIGVKRPKRYNFNSIEEMLKTVEAFKNIEGVCVYYDNDQNIKKVKGLKYLACHRFKEHATIENTIDLFFEFGTPSENDFKNQLIITFDWECFQMVEGFTAKVCDAYKQCETIVNDMISFVRPLKTISRKEAAQIIIEAYARMGRTSLAFLLLDGKELQVEHKKKIIYQLLKI